MGESKIKDQRHFSTCGNYKNNNSSSNGKMLQIPLIVWTFCNGSKENKNSLKIQFQFSTSKIHFVARVECAWKLCIINTSQVLPPYEAYNEIHQSEVQLSIHLLTFFPDSLLDFYTFFTPHTPRTRSTFSFPFPFAFAFSVFQFFNSTRVPPR